MEMRLLARFVGRYSQAFWRAFATGKSGPKQLTKIAIPAVAIILGLGNLGATPVTVPLDSLIGWGLFTMWAAVAAGIAWARFRRLDLEASSEVEPAVHDSVYRIKVRN